MITVTEILAPLVQFITSFISNFGYVGIFFLMILESALIPIPSEAIMPFSGFLVSVGKLGSVGVVLAGSFGNLVGSIATYYLGRRLGRTVIIKYGKYVLFRKKHLEYTERLFEKYGEKIAFVGRLLPGVRTYVSLPAGIGLTGFAKFAVYTFAGSLIWNAMLTYAGIELGINWKHIDKYSGYLYTIAIVSTIAIIFWILLARRANKSKTTTKI
jgi:membrane protein DedA with SNARE-associated domain